MPMVPQVDSDVSDCRYKKGTGTVAAARDEQKIDGERIVSKAALILRESMEIGRPLVTFAPRSASHKLMVLRGILRR